MTTLPRGIDTFPLISYVGVDSMRMRMRETAGDDDHRISRIACSRHPFAITRETAAPRHLIPRPRPLHFSGLILLLLVTDVLHTDVGFCVCYFIMFAGSAFTAGE